jgi:hypothetical protein
VLTIATLVSKRFRFIVTNVTPGSEAVTIWAFGIDGRRGRVSVRFIPAGRLSGGSPLFSRTAHGEDLAFPRLIYRGAPDTLGLGPHVNDSRRLVGETKRVNSQDELDEALKDGWRLTSQLEAPKAAAPKAAAPKKDEK